MAYINTTTGEYPLSAHQIRSAHSGSSLPEDLSIVDGYSEVQPTLQPAYDTLTQSLHEGDPVLAEDGRYKQTWDITALSSEQVAANQQAATQAFIASVTVATQARLDDFARTRNYDGILSACTYASSPSPKFSGEGQYCVNVRDATWATLYALMAQVQGGQRSMPATVADVLAELPVPVWPA
jgi:hypothetical protein